MSEISDMIQRLCPDGVEYRKLGEVVKIMNGKDYKSHQEGNIPVYGTGGILTYIDTAFDDGPTVLLPRKGSIDKVYYVDSPFWTVDTIYWTKFSRDSLVCPKFLYYFMTTINLSKMNTGTGAIPSLTQTVLSRIEIPVPPLEVQRKIVEVLDNFSELTAELTAELEARKKQYEYYRDNLLNFSQIAPPNSVKWMKLGDVFDTITDYTAAGSFKSIADNVKYLKKPNSAMLVRTTDLKSNFCKGDFIYIDDKAFQFLWRVNLDAECIVMPNVGNCGEVYYILPQNLPYEKCALAPNAILIKSTCNNNKYLSYILQTNDFQKQLKKITSPVGQSKFNKTEFKKLIIPIPPLSEQERIVSILDRFESLTTDLTSGLPAEIKARQQQYEYYRDQLLTFKRAN